MGAGKSESEEREQTLPIFGGKVFEAKERARTEVLQQSRRLETQGRDAVALTSQGSLGADFLLPWGMTVFLLRPLTDWMRPGHIMGGKICFTQPTDLNVNSI